MENDDDEVKERRRQERAADHATALRRTGESAQTERAKHFVGAIVCVTIGGFVAAACGTSEGVRGVAFVAVAAIAGIALLGRR